MSGVEHDPEALTDSAKLDQLLGLVVTMNTWLERQSKRLMTVEATGGGGGVGQTPEDLI
jgi:hypothetical protein